MSATAFLAAIVVLLGFLVFGFTVATLVEIRFRDRIRDLEADRDNLRRECARILDHGTIVQNQGRDMAAGFELVMRRVWPSLNRADALFVAEYWAHLKGAGVELPGPMPEEAKAA